MKEIIDCNSLLYATFQHMLPKGCESPEGSLKRILTKQGDEQYVAKAVVFEGEGMHMRIQRRWR
jgi:hypothetical protein